MAYHSIDLTARIKAFFTPKNKMHIFQDEKQNTTCEFRLQWILEHPLKKDHFNICDIAEERCVYDIYGAECDI